jgi:hypothetical protein
MNDQPMAELLLNDLPTGANVIADKGYDADWIRDLIENQNCTPHIPPKLNRGESMRSVIPATWLRQINAI